MTIPTVLFSSRKIFLGFFLLAIFSSFGLQAAERKRKPAKVRQHVAVGARELEGAEVSPEINSSTTLSPIGAVVVEEPVSPAQATVETRPAVENISIQEGGAPQKDQVVSEDMQKIPVEVCISSCPEERQAEVLASDKPEIPAPAAFSGSVQRLAFPYKDKYFLLIASWEKSTHADVCSYRIYVDGSLVREIPVTARNCFSFLKRTHSMKKQYQVCAVTKDGFESEKTMLTVSYPFDLSKKAKKQKRT